MYHSISNDNYFLSLSEKKFENQLKILSRYNFKSIFFEEVNFNNKDKNVIITFDDGYLDNYEFALPLLKKYNFKAINFIVSDLIGKDNSWDIFHPKYKLKKLMNKNQIKEWIQSGNKIGCHTANHKNIKFLNDNELNYEIIKSKKNLENEFGVPINYFSFPYGSINLNKLFMIKNIFDCSVTTLRSRYSSVNDKFLIPRVGINSTTSNLSFYMKIFTPYEDIKNKLLK